MALKDVQETLGLALAATKLKQVKVLHRPRLRSDNGPCYVSRELEEYLRHRTHPRHSLSSDRRIERFTLLSEGCRSKKNIIGLQNTSTHRCWRGQSANSSTTTTTTSTMKHWKAWPRQMCTSGEFSR